MTAPGLAVEVLEALEALLASQDADAVARLGARKALHRTLLAWRAEAGEDLALRVRTGVFFAGPLLLSLPGWTLQRVRALTGRLGELGLAGVDFREGVDSVALGRFAEAIAHARAGERTPWAALPASVVVLPIPASQRAASGWRELLVRELEPVRRASGHGAVPDLVPLRGLLQLAVDEAFDGVGARTLAEAAQAGGEGAEGTASLVLRSISIGSWMGLDRPQVLALSLAAVALDLLPGLGPREAAHRLLQWPGLGAVGGQVVLLVHDALDAAQGGQGGVAGKLLLKLQRSVARGPEVLVVDDEDDLPERPSGSGQAVAGVL